MRRVLILDDDGDNLGVMADLCRANIKGTEGSDYEIVSVRKSTGAVWALEENNRFDLSILDVHLGEGDKSNGIVVASWAAGMGVPRVHVITTDFENSAEMLKEESRVSDNEIKRITGVLKKPIDVSSFRDVLSDAGFELRKMENGRLIMGEN